MKRSLPALPQSRPRVTQLEVTQLVVIGASAGAVEPLRTLVAGFRPDGKTAYGIAQHVSPEHETLLPQLLQPRAAIAVQLASPQSPPLRLAPDHVYVIPATHDAEILGNGRLRLTPSYPRPGPHPSIDRLLLSAAHHFGAKTLAILLSGTGNDGVAGAIAVHRAGGIVWVQTPESAQFGELPRAVIATSAYSAAHTPEAMAALLPKTLTHLAAAQGNGATPPAAAQQPNAPAPPNPVQKNEAPNASATPQPEPPLTPEDQAAFDRILERVAPLLRVDLTAYLPETLLRQTLRAMQRSGYPDLATFADALEHQETAAEALARTLLIGVTAFWRDPAAFAALRIPLKALLETLPVTTPFRVWVCGCATGEEAYSLAFLITDCLTELGQQRHFVILGTDVSEGALQHARAARYPEEALAHLPSGWRERFFVREGALWRVHQGIRSQCVFSRHDALRELPFLHIHLISCRNLLIYLKPEARERLLKAFHYALVPGGLLFLGRSEALPPEVGEHFEAVSGPQRIFRRDEIPTPKTWLSATLPARLFLPQPAKALRPKLRPEEQLEAAIQHRLHETLLTRYAPPAILTDAQGRPLHILGDCSAFLHWPQGKSDFTLPALIPNGWRTPLRLVMRQLLLPTDNAPQTLPLLDADGAPAVQLYATRLDVAETPFLLFVFEPLQTEASVAPAHAPAAEAATDAPATRRETVLQRTVDRLTLEQEQRETLIDALERAQAELQALYEELQTTTEELQSANEELEAVNEELYASNEELRSLNEGLDRSLAEQAALNELLEAILNALTGPLLVLDESERLIRYNRAAETHFALTERHIGQPFPFDRNRIPWPESETRTALFAAARETPQSVELNDGTRYWLLTITHWTTDTDRAGFVLKLLETTAFKQAEIARLQLEERLITIAAALQEALFMAPATLDAFTYASPRLAEWLGVAPEALTWSHFLAAIDPNARPTVDAQWRRNSATWQQRYRLRTPKGGWRIVEERGVRIAARAHQPEQIAATLLDVTEAQRVAEQAAIGQARLAAVWENPTVGIALLDANGTILSANDPFAAWLGQTAETLVGRSFAAFTHPESALTDAQQWAALTQGRAAPYEKRIVAADGSTHWVMQHLNRENYPPPVGTFHVVIWQNIDTVKANEKLIYRQAHFDALTGLPNRALARDRIDRALARARREGETVYLLFLDLDGFKEVNDLYGHDAGDALLVETAARLKTCVRESDTVARLGGDEFLILVEGSATASTAQRIAESARDVLRQPFVVQDHRAQVTVSIGVAAFPNDAEDAETLMRLADAAMYAAKESGKNRVRFYSERIESKVRFEAEQRRALEHALANGEFELFLQPVVQLPERTVTTAEALLRWRHPHQGLRSAAEFIPLAEASGLIRPIGLWVLQEAARLALQLAAQRPGFRVAVNLSPAQFGDPAFARWAHEVEAALPHLTLEVTESLAMDAEGTAAAFLAQLREKGARLAIDDFGTGYANLSRLEALRPDVIKIDKCFTDRIGQQGTGEQIMRAILELTRAVGALAVVEGLESHAQLVWFEPFAPIAIQGYHFAKPMPWNEFQTFLEKRENC
ncbi:MAG: EAL domain-containing protein [Hydrogenophilus sp.]